MPRGTQRPVCSVPGCRRPHKSLGYCNPHRKRYQRHGDPLGGRSRTLRTSEEAKHRHPLPREVLVRLREVVGIGPNGPTKEQVRRWLEQEQEAA